MASARSTPVGGHLALAVSEVGQLVAAVIARHEGCDDLGIERRLATGASTSPIGDDA